MMQREIKILDKNVADKIAAGEVVDRPVSIVKELVENAIDSGADNITVEMRDGGKSYLRVTDNGCGIDSDYIETAFQRHATSKISTATDLDSILTLGFRGEALASICAVSRVEVITKTADSKIGRRVIAESSEIRNNDPTGCPEGTTITVKDLFFNVPARRKFLASDGAESRRIVDLVSRFALAYPDIRFKLINGSRVVFNTSGKGNILENIIQIYGSDLGRDLIQVSGDQGNSHIRGFVSNPGMSLSSRSRQIFCVNGRIVSSPLIERALEKAYKERLFSGRFPIAFLFIAVPPESIDVNIHPTKKEIRFHDNAEIEDFITETVKKALTHKEAVPEVRHKADRPAPELSPLPEGRPQTEMTVEENGYQEEYDVINLLSTIRDKVSVQEEAASEYIRSAPQAEDVSKPFDFNTLSVIGVLFDTYILATDEHDFYMLDQHAAHERVFYEKLLHQFHSAEKYSQQLMVPLNFTVPADTVSTEDQWIGDVRNMGYDIEFFGNHTYIVREIPAFMDMSEAENFLTDILNQFADRPDLTDPSRLDKIITRSCKSAVKGGDHLTSEEITALMDQLKQCNNPYSCPHGRPTFVRMTKYEIEKMFKRV
ncbi:MAG: DNA mismatch repair endonuclease MutL [Bacillota bacterium]|nr:DNA mismatch repair endonuclease MutL [Bacillota bacterium]